MTLSDVSIRRPVLTWVMMLACVVFGLLGFLRLGVDQFPAMEFPNVTVNAVLPGAGPEAVETDVTEILEEHLASVPGVREIRSLSAPGGSHIDIQFDLGVDVDIAVQDVRDKVALARAELPPEVEPPFVARISMDDNGMIVWIPVQTQRSAVETTEIVRQVVKPLIETIPGVASAQMFGSQKRNVRIWLDGSALRARGLAANDVLAAIRREHVEIGAGAVEGAGVRYGVKTAGEFESIEELADLVIRDLGGAPIRLRDVARIEDGAEDEQTLAHFLGEPTVGLGVGKQSNANTVAIADEVYERVERINEVLPPDIRMHGKGRIIDMSMPIREAVAETNFALILGAVLAVLTVFVFLRRWRPTLIVAAAIPLSLITSFGVTWLFGFTLNTMTLLAMALVVGIVIDDAIVVLENIERHRELGADSFQAAETGTREIAFAATAATVAIGVVFLPAIFAGGIVGNFLGEFGVTVASSVMISLFVALTLTPMLAARIPRARERAHGSIYHRLERGFDALERRYRSLLHVALARRRLTLTIAALSLVAAIGLASRLDAEFFPPSDEGLFFAMFEARPGTTLRSTEAQVGAVERWLTEQPDLAGLFLAVGMGGPMSRLPRPHMGMLVGVLVPAEERERSYAEFVTAARERFAEIPGLQVKIIDVAAMMGAAFSADITGTVSLDELDELSARFLARLRERGGFVDLDRNLEIGLPEIRVMPDRRKAAALGIDAETLGTVVEAMIGGLDVASFKDAGRRHDIRVRLEEKDRQTPDAVGRIAIRSRSGEIVELRNVADVRLVAAPADIARIDRQRSVQIEANLTPDKRMSRAISDAEEIAAEVLPEGVSLRFSGQAEQFREGMAEFAFALVLAVIVIYLVLAAQFESFLHPLTVMLALPLAMVGALGALAAAGMTVNLFSLIGIIMLFGLVTKNSILLVDYANHLRERGLDKVEAMRQAAPVRLRPVLMTAVSMIFGVLPAAVGVGPGASTRQPMALAVAAGMFSSTLLTLVVVPVFYIALDELNEHVKERLRRWFRRAEPARRVT